MRSWLFVFLCFSLIFLTAGVVGKVFAANGTRTVRIGVYDNKPKVYYREDGVASGLFPDILNYIAKQESWQLEYVFGTWEEGLARLEKGEIDMMVDVAVSDERRKIFDFTNETILSSWGVVFVHKDSTIESFQDLDGKKIAILHSSVYYGGPDGIDAYTRAFGLDVEFINVNEYAEVFDLLNKGEVDAAVVSRVFALANKGNYPNIKETDIFFKPTELRFALTKGDPDNLYLIERVDYWVKKLKRGHEGVYQQLLERYGLEGMLVSEEVSPKWLIPVEIAGGVVFLLLLVVITRLIVRREIVIRKLRDSEEKFSKAFQISPNAIAITRVKDGVFLDVNDTFLAKTGYTREEVFKGSSAGLNLWVNEQDRERMLADLRAGRAVTNREYQLRTKSGDIITGLLSAEPINLGRELCILSSVSDITEHKKVEEEIKARTKELEKLSKSQEETKRALLNVMADLKDVSARNEAILASIAQGVVVVDRGGIIILLNSSAEKMLGWKASDAVGKKWFQVLKIEDAKENPVSPEQGVIKAALVRGTTSLPSVASPYYYVRKDGTKFPIARTVSPISIGGKVVGAVDIFRDITNEKELDQMKDDFMDIAAHDLRTPAAAIRGFISRVLDGDAGKISSKAKELLGEAYVGNMRLIRLVDDFLVVSRIERGKIKIVPKPSDLTKIVDISINGFSDLVKEKGLKLEYRKVSLPQVLADEERTVQVLNNLIDNAIKYTEKGGITISHTIDKDMVITKITDTGIGIPAETQKNLFQKYFKGDESASRSGLGLGLYISRLNIEGSGGKIWIDSKEGKGSTFSFSLPIAK